MNLATRIAWNESFSVGNNLIDQQHRRLFDICNELGKCIQLPAGVERSNGILRQNDLLVRYVTEHFATEEALLSEHHWSELDAHRKEHVECEQFICSDQTREMLLGDGASKLHMYLVRWIRFHVLIQDVKYKPVIQQAH